MNRQLHSLSSQELTLNITLKDLNIEARKILRRKLLKDNVQTSREESDVYVSGPYFPCGKYKKKRLRRNSRTSLTTNCENDGGISKAEKGPFVEIVIMEDKSNQTELVSEVEHRKTKVFESCENSKKRQSVTTEECLQGTTMTSLKEKGKSLSSSPNSRRSSELEVRSRGTSPLSERRRDSRMSTNENKTSPNHSRSNAATDHFALKNILNPLLRESLKKILDPQSYAENAIPNDTGNISALAANDSRTIFKDDILLPKIKRRLVKYSSMDYGDQRSSLTNDSLRDKYKKKSTRHVGFNEQSPELTSTKCTGIKVIRSDPVRMLSDSSEYAVKGIIGQWLKRRSGNTVQAGSVEKQEAYREVQLLKVGMSMRMLAGIV